MLSLTWSCVWQQSCSSNTAITLHVSQDDGVDLWRTPTLKFILRMFHLRFNYHLSLKSARVGCCCVKFIQKLPISVQTICWDSNFSHQVEVEGWCCVGECEDAGKLNTLIWFLPVQTWKGEGLSGAVVMKTRGGELGCRNTQLRGTNRETGKSAARLEPQMT